MTRTTQKRFSSVLLVIVGGAIVVFLFSGVIYESFSWQMTGYDKYAKCNRGGRISRIEWFLGARPLSEICWR